MQSNSSHPTHVAIIMDGNGRWAAQRGLPRAAGHRAGVATVRRIVERADDAGIGCLTLYAFSSDNWRRPAAEVKTIFWLLRAFLRLQTVLLRQRGARLQVIGRRDRLPPLALREIERAEEQTAAGTGLHLRIAIDYSSRDAIAGAALAAIQSADSLLSPASTSSLDDLRPHLARFLTADAGEVDLLVRTGGEKRLSDFLLWECAYAELLFTDRMWPDFNPSDFDAVLDEFKRRQRRFGAVPQPATAIQLAS